MRYIDRPLPLQPRCRPACIVCGKPLGKATKRRLVCSSSRCLYQLQHHSERVFGIAHNDSKNAAKSTIPEKPSSARYPYEGIALNGPETPAKSKLKTGEKPDRAFRHVAGAEMAEFNYQIPLDLPVSRADREFREYL